MEPQAKTPPTTVPEDVVASKPRFGSEPYEQRRLKLLAEQVHGKTVLDLGHAAMPNRYFSGVHTTGFDMHPSSDPSIKYDEEVVANCEDMLQVFSGRSFDTVVAGELIEHLENPYQFMRDVRTLLADDGHLVVSTPNPFGFPVFLAEFLRSKRFYYDPEHTYYFLPRWLERIGEYCGLRLLRTVPVGLLLPNGVIPWSPTILSYQLIYVFRKK